MRFNRTLGIIECHDQERTVGLTFVNNLKKDIFSKLFVQIMKDMGHRDPIRYIGRDLNQLQVNKNHFETFKKFCETNLPHTVLYLKEIKSKIRSIDTEFEEYVPTEEERQARCGKFSSQLLMLTFSSDEDTADHVANPANLGEPAKLSCKLKRTSEYRYAVNSRHSGTERRSGAKSVIELLTDGVISINEVKGMTVEEARQVQNQKLIANEYDDRSRVIEDEAIQLEKLLESHPMFHEQQLRERIEDEESRQFNYLRSKFALDNPSQPKVRRVFAPLFESRKGASAAADQLPVLNQEHCCRHRL